ncbi:hypothetical protein PUR61_23995 [Streptomyces sp. BE20]|uniref:hypothetical protein n=1 Tax=Streptomyces sp. BE20 TaxID=3002525 RepID=UPI002E79BDB7|nr:hypothetical protein [Streptomyces sp. BE20]MEE1825220.1 hypothetical protein [Streptomyces sp. BE20]
MTAHPQAALYLRCYLSDPSDMECHRRAKQRLAVRHSLPDPFVYIDNGRRHPDGLPQLEQLERRIANGWIDTLLIPGPFVFVLDDRQAAATVRRLRRLGCRLSKSCPGGPIDTTRRSGTGRWLAPC